MSTEESSFINMLEALAQNTSMGDLQNVAFDMVDHFLVGSGEDYSNTALTDAIKEHDNTQLYVSAVKEQLIDCLSAYNGDIKSLEYTESAREESPMVIWLNGIALPYYGSPKDLDFEDVFKGLTFCIHGWWGAKVEVTSFKKESNNYSGTLKFTLYDHFGLDSTDARSYSLFNGFKAWYILQHNKEYNGAHKPFVTIIELEESFSGTL